MSKGRGSAVVAGMVVAMVAMAVVFQGGVAEAATYTVGGVGGWSFNAASWPSKTLKAGDTLVFNYNPSAHNVVVVNRAGYTQCMTPRGAKVYQTGKDQIKLVKGTNYFICTFPTHCESGMKMAVLAN